MPCLFSSCCYQSFSPLGVEQNGQVFRENGGTSCTLSLLYYSTPRRMALKLLRQLILLAGGCGIGGCGGCGAGVTLCMSLFKKVPICNHVIMLVQGCGYFRCAAFHVT